MGEMTTAAARPRSESEKRFWAALRAFVIWETHGRAQRAAARLGYL
jgi:hypothetical protein